jgi:predicted solute-binding protein
MLFALKFAKPSVTVYKRNAPELSLLQIAVTEINTSICVFTAKRQREGRRVDLCVYSRTVAVLSLSLRDRWMHTRLQENRVKDSA